MVWEGTQSQNMRPNRFSHYNIILKSSMNTVLFVNATIGFSENLFLVYTSFTLGLNAKLHESPVNHSFDLSILIGDIGELGA